VDFQKWGCLLIRHTLHSQHITEMYNSVTNVKIDRSKQCNKLYIDKQSNGTFKNHSRGNVSHNDRNNDFSVDSSAHVYSNRWGNSNNNKDSYRSAL
jgi:hypothetical protein